MNDLFELNFHPSQHEATHGNGPEDGEGLSAASTQETLTANSARWRQIPPVSGGMAVHRFCHVGAVYKGTENSSADAGSIFSQCTCHLNGTDNTLLLCRISLRFWWLRWK